MFTVFKKVLNPKAIFSDEDIKKVSDFVFCRWLAGNAGTMQIAQMFNVYSNIPVEIKLKCAQNIINGRIRYIPYIKSEKEVKDDDINSISEYFNISIPKAKMYSEFISDKDLLYIKKCLESKYFKI